MFKIFPTKFIKECIETYTKEHGKIPKVLCVSKEDYADWMITCSIVDSKKFDLEIIVGDYLEPGQFDFATGIKNNSGG